MMNFTAISLTLLWNSPIYCICSNLSSSSCSSKCTELGYIYIPNDISIFKSLRSNMHHEISFILIQDPESTQSFCISFPYFLLKYHTVSLISSNKNRININLSLDISNEKIFKEPGFSNDISKYKSSLKLINVDLTFSLSSITLYKLDSIEFEYLSLKNSSITVFQNEKNLKITSKRFFVDDESLKYFILNNLNDNRTLIIEENNITNCTIYLYSLQLKIDELYLFLTHSSNVVIFKDSLLSFSTDSYIFDTDIYQNITLFSINMTYNKIQLIQSSSIKDTNEGNDHNLQIFNISVFINSVKSPISCDFSSLTSSYINACVKYENKTKIFDMFEIDIGSNTINIVRYSIKKEEIVSMTSNYLFSISEQFTSTSIFTPITEQQSNNISDDSSNILSDDSFYSGLDSTENPTLAPTSGVLATESPTDSQIPIENTDLILDESEYSIFETSLSDQIISEPNISDQTYIESISNQIIETDISDQTYIESISNQIPIATPTSTPKPEYLFEPFFFIGGDGEILVDSIPIALLNNDTQVIKDFTISDNNIENLSELFKSISNSPYQSISLVIDLHDKIPLIIPSSIFFRKSFHIVSKSENQVIFLEYLNFSIGTTQNFTNVIINSLQPSRIIKFYNLSLKNSLINCTFACENGYMDFQTLLNQKSLSNIYNPICENIYIEIPKNMNFMLYPIQKTIIIMNQTFEFNCSTIQKIFLIFDGNSSVNFESLNNETGTSIDNRIYFTFIVNKNDFCNQSTITFNNTENITNELAYFSIDARSAYVKVLSIGFEFSTKNTIRVEGDKNVNLNSINALFFDNYCICSDVNQSFDCLDVCKPEMGPILPFDKEVISNTVKVIPIKYVNYTIFGSSVTNNPYFEYSLFNNTSIDIQPGHLPNQTNEGTNIAYLTLETSDRNVIPNSNVICKLSNLSFIIVAPQGNSSLYLNFATAFFSSLEFIIPKNSTLTISSEAVDTDVLTLLKFPSNLIFSSPTQMCNISCSTIISTIIILSNQQIDLLSEKYNISYKLDLSLLYHTPANISCEYGTSKAAPLKILLLEDQPKSLVDIPDLRFDVSRNSESEAYVEFPDQWNSKIEDVSSKIEIFHNEKTLYIQGKVVDDVYTTKPPTIFHNGAGYLYINGILSTFKIKYCICDINNTECSNLCKSIGPVIPFDQESITATIKSNPTRHITYIIYGSTYDYRPYFRLSDFAVKSFTLSSDTTDFKSNQYIDLEIAPAAPVVPLNHRFISLSIRPTGENETADLKFHNLYIENSMIDSCYFPYETDHINFDDDKNENDNNNCFDENCVNYPLFCTLSQISLTIDIESAYELTKTRLLSPFQSLTIIGKRSLSRVIMESKSEIDAYSNIDENIFVRFNLSQLNKDSAVSISTLLGSQNRSSLSVELPSHEITFEQIPLLRFDLTQVDGSHCFMIFPSSMWVGPLSNLSEKIVVEYGRHDFYQESSKHDGRYDGIPPIVSVIGSGGYYINGILFSDEIKLPTPKATQKPFRSLGPSAIAGIVIGSVAFVVIVVGIIIILILKRKQNKSIQEQTSDTIRQVNLGLVDMASDEYVE